MVAEELMMDKSGKSSHYSLVIGADTSNAQHGFKQIQKNMGDTGKSAVKAGKDGKEAMDKWATSLKAAGAAAYDFGSASFQSTTVASAIGEFISGTLEQTLQDLFSGDISAIFETFDPLLGSKVGDAVETGLKAAAGQFPKEIQDQLNLMALGVVIKKDELQNDVETAWNNGIAGVQSTVASMLGDAAKQAKISEVLAAEDYSKVAESFFAPIKEKITMKMPEALAAAGDTMDIFRRIMGEQTGGLISPDMIEKKLEEVDPTKFKEGLAIAVQDGLLSAAESDVVVNALNEAKFVKALKTQMEEVAKSFAEGLKDPAKYQGLGTIITTTILNDITHPPGGGQ